MKKQLITLAILLGAAHLSAQTEFDAIRYAQTDIWGTARYMGLGGAFGALGGDASGLRDNPAGLGIYRSSEFTGTLGFNNQNSDANWLGVNSNNNLFRVNMNNLSVVMANKTFNAETGRDGLLQSNFSFSVNRVKDFNRNVSIYGKGATASMTDFMADYSNGLTASDVAETTNYSPWDNLNVPWISIMAYKAYLMNPGPTSGSWTSVMNTKDSHGNFLYAGQTVAPNYKLLERGGINEYSFGWGGNFNNFFYLGASLNLQSVDYTGNSSYTESLPDGQSFTLDNTVKTNGYGFNMRIGTIIQPVEFMRVGLSFQTPSFLSLTDELRSQISFAIDTLSVNDVTGRVSDRLNANNSSIDYQLQGPIKMDLSTAFFFGKKGLLSLEYNRTNYKGTRLRDTNSDPDVYSKENDGIGQQFNNTQTYKAGLEYRLSTNFSVRAGYAYASAVTKSDANKYIRNNTVRTDNEFFRNEGTQYLSGGFGYRTADWSFDVAYVHKQLKETFMPYEASYLGQSNSAKVTTTNNNVLFTLGYRF